MAHKYLCRFATQEDGAVTVDWVVLTAALVGLGIASATVISGGLQDISTDTAATMSGTNIVFMSRNFGMTPTDKVNALVFEVPRSQPYATNRLNSLLAGQTDDELRRNQNTWWERTTDAHPYADKSNARDQAQIFDVALETRGLEPISD